MNLSKTFAVLTPTLGMKPVEVTSDLYERLDRDFAQFQGHVLVSMYAFDGDWPTWERHPAGDELVMLLAGEAEFVFDRDGRHETTRLAKPGDFAIVPRGTWHTAKIRERAEILFVTPGEGTENREIA